jgi:hypothetical protein
MNGVALFQNGAFHGHLSSTLLCSDCMALQAMLKLCYLRCYDSTRRQTAY